MIKLCLIFLSILAISVLGGSFYLIHIKLKAKIECEDKGGLMIERHINNFVCIKPEIIK